MVVRYPRVPGQIRPRLTDHDLRLTDHDLRLTTHVVSDSVFTTARSGVALVVHRHEMCEIDPGVHLGGGERTVTEEFLDCPQIHPRLQ